MGSEWCVTGPAVTVIGLDYELLGVLLRGSLQHINRMIKSLFTSLLKTFLLCSWVLHMVQSGLVLFGLVCGILLNSCKLLQGPGRSCSNKTRRRPINTQCTYKPSLHAAPTLQWSSSTGTIPRVPAVILPMQPFSWACRYRIYRVYVNFK
jgi:hypothetical protein